MLLRALLTLTGMLLFAAAFAQDETVFQQNLQTPRKPWTSDGFFNDPRNFQFAIVTDRTGGHRDGVFEKGVEKLNLLFPEFVMSVGDLIEGYTTDTTEINAMWHEWDSILNPLNFRFFAVPGNHDISNDVMRQTWLNRYGHSYYHFRYKDVLFLAMDTNDGEGVQFSRAQLDYMKKAIADNKNVRWTLLFMHHPVWNYKEYNGFPEIEEALKDRPYTVIAGHNHRYLKKVKQERNYYILGTTGGGSELRGPRLGEYDHVTWVTITDQGPQLVNLALSGIITDDVLNEDNVELAQALIRASRINCLLLQKNANEAVAFYNIENLASKPLYFQGRYFHNHHLEVSENKMDLTIAPKSSAQAVVNIKIAPGKTLADIDPLELDWQVFFESPFMEPPYKLTGTHKLPDNFITEDLTFTEMSIFLQNHDITLSQPYQNVTLRYTLDGSEPTAQSPAYTQPIKINATTTIKVRFFDASNQAKSEIIEKTYRKVVPLAGVTVKKAQNGLKYKFYEGMFTKMPDFKMLTQKREGIATDFNMEKMAQIKNHYAFVFEGFVEVPEDGLYNFYTHSDDGSKLFIHNELVVDNDGSHSARTRRGNIALRKGIHPIRIEYFEDFEGEELRLGYEVNGKEAKEITFKELFYQK